MSYSVKEATQIVDIFAEKCEARDGDCSSNCPLSDVRVRYCPFENYSGAIDLVTGMSGLDRYAYPKWHCPDCGTDLDVEDSIQIVTVELTDLSHLSDGFRESIEFFCTSCNSQLRLTPSGEVDLTHE